MKYLIQTTEVYRFSSENEATEFIEKAKKEPGYVLTKSTVEYKEKKQKGDEGKGVGADAPACQEIPKQ